MWRLTTFDHTCVNITLVQQSVRKEDRCLLNRHQCRQNAATQRTQQWNYFNMNSPTLILRKHCWKLRCSVLKCHQNFWLSEMQKTRCGWTIDVSNVDLGGLHFNTNTHSLTKDTRLYTNNSFLTRHSPVESARRWSCEKKKTWNQKIRNRYYKKGVKWQYNKYIFNLNN